MWATLSKAAKYFQILIVLLPKVITAILYVESLFPEKGQGSKKRAMVREALEAAFEIVKDGKVDFATEIWPAVEAYIAKKVAEYNQAGWPAPDATTTP